ncbi:MAG: 1-acyl-sn-glycerol-3-phosphate acyltransferase [Gammaproteobacteria bacterium]|nr:1-acyl-sn-glycerol-3-phosphate acyltransferase [Gammaproteobacteria bacterium]
MTQTESHPPYLVLWLRSLAFWLVFPVTIVCYAILLLFTFPFTLRVRWALLQSWVNFILWWLRVTCKLTHEIQGLEHIPDGAGIVFSKHQSTWETIALQQIFPLQVWVAKRELMWIPFFGWGLALMKCIAIKRGTGRAAVRQLVTQGKARLEQGIWIVIFPEGTRIPAGQKGHYRIGGAILAEHSGFPIVPVAHNGGEYWPRRSFIKRPGVIQVRIGAPITSNGKSAQQVLEEAADWIEARMDEITTLK